MQLPAPTFCAEFPVAKIRPGANIRPKASAEFLADLAQSLKNGQLQPIGVTESGDLIWGYQRYYAAVFGQLPCLAANVFPDTITPAERVTAAIVENLHRREMSDWDTFQAVVSLEESGMARGEIAKAIGVSPPRMATYFSPPSCPPEVMEHLEAGRLTLGKCKVIADSLAPRETMKLLLGGASIKEAVAAIEQADPTESEDAGADEGKDKGKKGATVPIALPGGHIIIKSKGELPLSRIVELLGEAHEQAKNSHGLQQTLRTFVSLMKDRAKRTPVEKKAGKKNRAKDGLAAAG